VTRDRKGEIVDQKRTSRKDPYQDAVAIVGVGAVMPDAGDAPTFWSNIKAGRYSIGDVPPGRWDPDLYYDPDRSAPDRTYSRIGGFVRDFEWAPFDWKLPIPPRVGQAMDRAQKWAIVATRQALSDFGYPERELDRERTAVILGNAMAGDMHYLTAARIMFPEIAQELYRSPAYNALPEEQQRALSDQLRAGVDGRFPAITEDTMPGELSNIIAGRVASLFDLHGPNFVTDAACASSMAAITAAVDGLREGAFDMVITGGVDANMGPTSFIKFSKIGALSATGSRPYDAGADGFVMGEGAALFLLRRLPDAEAAGDKIYAVIRGFGGSSDGRGRGIVAPNPAGQVRAIMRAWEAAGCDPSSASLIEGHGTSTSVGDTVELQCLEEVFGGPDRARGSLSLGSVKSNIGHLKGAAGAAGILKATLALHDKILPPSLGYERAGQDMPTSGAVEVNRELRPWAEPECGVRRAGVSSFGFGGTNFHAVLEEYVPGRLAAESRPEPAPVSAREATPAAGSAAVVREAPAPASSAQAEIKRPVRGALVVGGRDSAEVSQRLARVLDRARAGEAPAAAPPSRRDLEAPVRVAMDFGDADELAARAEKALRALDRDDPAMWRVLQAQGVFHGAGPAGKVAFLFTGQGSQYVNMFGALCQGEALMAGAMAEADSVMTPLLGRTLSSHIFVQPRDEAHARQADLELRQTAVTQPALLAVEAGLVRMLAAYGVEPDMVMGHSLGEYGALMAAGALSFPAAMEAVSARGKEMSNISTPDNGAMVAVMGALGEIQAIVGRIRGYVVIANINSNEQAVVGGATEAVREASEALVAAGMRVTPLPVSHAFHTEIVAPASEPLRRTLARLDLQPPRVPVVANVTGVLYPTGHDVRGKMLDMLSRQVASPVQFVKGLHTLYERGARVFVEIGPKKALYGFVQNVLGHHDDLVALFTNHPKVGDLPSFNQCLCGLYAAGLGSGVQEGESMDRKIPAVKPAAAATPGPAPSETPMTPRPLAVAPAAATAAASAAGPAGAGKYEQLGRLFEDFIGHAARIVDGGGDAPRRGPVVITGTALGLPGGERVFGDDNLSRMLAGQQLIKPVPAALRQAMADKGITRLRKSADGAPRFETITDPADVIKLAGRAGALDLTGEFGVPEERVSALDSTTRLAIGAGLEAMRDAGLPMVMRYRTTTRGRSLPDRWGLPDALRDDTGVIFASAFPGLASLVDEVTRFHRADNFAARVADLESLQQLVAREHDSSGELSRELARRLEALRQEAAAAEYKFDRRFLFKVLAMGHSQFAELIGARGPNTQINSACASGTQALSLAQDWINAGRCRRVICITADDVTNDRLMEWMGAGFLASGAAATDERVEDAALPFDRRRHGLVLGMGASGMVVESEEAARERGLSPICEVLGTVTANSAFHGSRLDPAHIAGLAEGLLSDVEQRYGLRREEMAPRTVFVSHETYTPARGGSAQAEVQTLRAMFGQAADSVVIANTKGLTGHAMGAGMEDALAVRVLETGKVPPVINFKEPDPELGQLNLSQGGDYRPTYALRLGAGFGSQLSLALLRHVPSPAGRRPEVHEVGYGHRIADPARWGAWLKEVSGEAAPVLEVAERTLRFVDGEAVENRTAPAPAPEPVPEPEEQPSTSSSTSTSGGRDEVEERVLNLVAEQTGYPLEMLELDLDMEADLGVDTVKQAETFSAVREAYGIEMSEDMKLRDMPTLEHVVQWVMESRSNPAPAPAPEEHSSTSALTGRDEVVERVLNLVAEQTGYPLEMLELDLDMEADLGVDTVKQAETFSAVREAYGIEMAEDVKLRDMPTLEHVVQWVMESRGAGEEAGDPPTPTATDTAAATGSESSTPTSSVGEEMIGLRAPWPVLRPPLELCKATGVSLAEGDRVLVMPDRYGVARSLVSRLAGRGVEVLELDRAWSSEELEEQLRVWLDSGPVRGVFWLSALDGEGEMGEMDLAAWREALAPRVMMLFRTMRGLVSSAAGDAAPFLVAGTRLGGTHGYGDLEEKGDAVAPMGGAVTGFAKSYKREQPAALVKAVDLAASRKKAPLADLLIAEAERDPGVVEVGYRDGERWTVGLVPVEALPLEAQPDAKQGVALTPETVYLVTGAAGSIVSAIVADLARGGGGGVFHLLDLASCPEADDPDVARFETDREGLLKEIFGRLKAEGRRATPAMVEREVAGIERKQAALAAREAIRQAGGTAVYHQVDLRDELAVAAAVEKLQREHNHVDVLLHAAGLEISRPLPDKSPEEFDLVFGVKSDGWINLISALGETPVGATVAFSSIAGRFGNAGQTDYAAANDLLCKAAAGLNRQVDGPRALALDWTAWAGIGMATRGSIPKIMEQAGIEMLDPAAGVPLIRQQLAAGATGELVVAGELGVLMQEFDAAGGLDLAAVGEGSGRIMASQAVSMGLHTGLVVESTLDPADHPFLHDHRIDGTPVLPGVMGIEGFAQAARLLAPGREIVGLEDVDFLAPFKFYRDEPRTVRLQARLLRDGDELIARCSLTGERYLPGAGGEPRVTTHFTASVRLARSRAELESDERVPTPNGDGVDRDDIYRLYFHGPAYQVVERAWRHNGSVAGVLPRELPRDLPLGARGTLTDPRLIELCFQTAGVWEAGKTGRMGLPRHIHRITLGQRGEDPSDAGRLVAVVTPGEGGEEASYDAYVADEAGRIYLTVSGYSTVQHPDPLAEDVRRPLREAMD